MLIGELHFRLVGLRQKENDHFEIFLPGPLIDVLVGHLEIFFQSERARRDAGLFGDLPECRLITLLALFQFSLGEIPISPPMIQKQIFRINLPVAIFLALIDDDSR